MIEKEAQNGEGIITCKVAVYAPAKRADTLPYFISTPLYSVDQPQTGPGKRCG
jgi:hypothetical protein